MMKGNSVEFDVTQNVSGMEFVPGQFIFSDDAGIHYLDVDSLLFDLMIIGEYSSIGGRPILIREKVKRSNSLMLGFSYVGRKK